MNCFFPLRKSANALSGPLLPWWKNLFCLICFLILSISFGETQPVEEGSPLEASLARAYLYLVSRTTWPDDTKSSMLFCINRDHSLFEAFAKLVPTFNYHGKPFLMKSFDENDIETQRSCSVIALSNKVEFNKSVISQVSSYPVLTIGHETDITLTGGIIYLAYGKRLEPPKVNILALGVSKLKMDASVLDLSKRRWSSDE